MMLDHLFIIGLNVSAQTQNDDQLGAIFGAPLEFLLSRLP